jgi:acetolactate decarboxylase
MNWTKLTEKVKNKQLLKQQIEKKICWVFVFFSILLVGNISYAKQPGMLFQSSTISALLKGYYDGNMTFKELKTHGDFGIGTVNDLDGEMVAVDGKFYQIKSDGKVYLVTDDMKTPFAVTTFFVSSQTIGLTESLNYEQLTKYLNGLLDTKNIFYAIKISGEFEHVKTRSVPKQAKPYVPLSEVVKKQSVFEFNSVKGTIVGFYNPAYVDGINVAEYHLHFINDLKKSGGHLLDCKIKNVKIEIDPILELDLKLPDNDDFKKMDLSKPSQTEINKIEK